MTESAGAKFRFAASDQKTVIPLELTKNGLFFPVRSQASAPIWFSLDSGSGATYLDLAVARKLGLRSQGKRQVRGAGEGTVDVDVVGDVAFEMRGLSTWGHEIHLVDFEGVRAGWGRQFDGFFGHDFLERFVVIVDYRAKQLTIMNPRDFHYTGSGNVFALEFQGRLPFIRATVSVAGHVEESLFLVDTGSRDAVDHPLIANAPDAHPTRAGVGFGSETTGLFGSVDKLRLGPFEIERLSGVAGTGLGSHLIGGQVLSRFRVIFDYQRKRMMLEAQKNSVRVISD